MTVNGGGDCLVVGGHFALTGDHAGMLLGILPPIVHLRKESDKAAMRWSLERMRQELREGQPGGFLMAQHLAHLMLLQALRLHLAEGSGASVGWLFALGDKHISAAIGAIHEAPAHRWTLQALAERAGMSRSTFALRFKETVGASPMEYLTRWRMLLAGDKLTNSSEPVSVLARSLGYKSESAFSTAFKQVMGCSPRQYGRGGAAASLEPAQEEAAGAEPAGIRRKLIAWVLEDDGASLRVPLEFRGRKVERQHARVALDLRPALNREVQNRDRAGRVFRRQAAPFRLCA